MPPQNTVSGYCRTLGPEMCDRLSTYVDTNEQWVLSLVEKHGDSDPYWHQVLTGAGYSNKGISEGILSCANCVWCKGVARDVSDLV